jgi:uncharacterized RDD family membrane protein YckC
MTDQYGSQWPQVSTTTTQPSSAQPPASLSYPSPPGHLVPSPASEYASWGKRVRARLIDQIPTYLGLIIFCIGYLILIIRLALTSGSTLQVHGATITMIIGLGAMLISLVWVAYNRWLTAGRTGQSLGKRVTKIRVVGEETNAPIGSRNAFIRDLVHILDAITVVGYLWPLWHDKRQTFADQIMRTVVVTNEAADSRRS